MAWVQAVLQGVDILTLGHASALLFFLPIIHRGPWGQLLSYVKIACTIICEATLKLPCFIRFSNAALFIHCL